MKHVCHAEACEVEVLPAMLMCKEHWFKVPPHIRREIWRTYVPGQEITKTPSDEYMAAYQKAVDAVAVKEGRR